MKTVPSEPTEETMTTNAESATATPRTDASYVVHYGDGLGQWVPREFAQQLERELTAARAEIEWAKDLMLKMLSIFDAIEAIRRAGEGAK